MPVPFEMSPSFTEHLFSGTKVLVSSLTHTDLTRMTSVNPKNNTQTSVVVHFSGERV